MTYENADCGPYLLNVEVPANVLIDFRYFVVLVVVLRFVRHRGQTNVFAHLPDRLYHRRVPLVHTIRIHFSHCTPIIRFASLMR